MKSGSIPSSWMQWSGHWDASFLLAVLAEVDAQGIDHQDEAKVKAIMAQLGFMRERVE